MYDKIEKRLAEYEKRSPVTSDEELLEALSAIVSDERKKRRRCDLDLVNEATELSLSVKGYDVDKIKERGREIARRETAKLKEEKPAKTFRPTRLFILIPAVAFLVAMLAFSASSSSMGDYVFNASEINDHEPGVWYQRGENSEYIIAKDYINDIKSVEELEAIVNNPDVIMPYGITELFPMNEISYSDFVIFKSILIQPGSLMHPNIDIKIGQSFQVELETKKIGMFDVCIGGYDDPRGYTYAADFQFRGSIYQIRTLSELDMYAILDCFIRNCRVQMADS